MCQAAVRLLTMRYDGSLRSIKPNDSKVEPPGCLLPLLRLHFRAGVAVVPFTYACLAPSPPPLHTLVPHSLLPAWRLETGVGDG